MKKKKKKKKKKKIRNQFLNHFENDSTFSLFEVIVLILISVVFGVIIGYLLTYGNSNLRRVRSNSNLGEVVNTYNSIIDNYYDEVDEKKLSDAAIKGMISSLEDPYSSFLDESMSGDFNKSVDGEYVGIGIAIYFEGEYNHVSSITKNSPASQAGIQEGDIILSVNEKDCKGLYPNQLYELISGSLGGTVTLEVLRGEEKLSFVMKRDVIEIQSVTGKVFSEEDGKIGYIKIDVISSNSYEQFSKVLKRLEKKEIDSLILDLRDNPGGQLDQTRKILSMFFPKKTILYRIEKSGSIHKIYSLNQETRDYPIVVLVNGNTASSAEVIASCFQENYKEVHLVGTKTYGKGNVQKSISLRSGSSIKFTVESWLTSKGVQVNGKGITPDIEEEQDPVYYVEYLEKDDSQLHKAISLLK